MTDNQPLQIKAMDETMKGHYANLMQIHATPEEFCLDFVSAFPPAGSLVSRVIVSPSHLKRMSQVINTVLAKYEKEHGKVQKGEEPNIEMGFRAGEGVSR